jgi:hypothetical protein
VVFSHSDPSPGPAYKQLSDDWRKTNLRFSGDNFQCNLRIVEEVKAIAAEESARVPLEEGWRHFAARLARRPSY